MALTDDIYARALELLGEDAHEQVQGLSSLCAAAAGELLHALRDGVTAEDCGETLVTAAAMLALSLRGEISCGDGVGSFKAGEVSYSKNGGSGELGKRAWELMKRWCRPGEGFAFLGVSG